MQEMKGDGPAGEGANSKGALSDPAAVSASTPVATPFTVDPGLAIPAFEKGNSPQTISPPAWKQGRLAFFPLIMNISLVLQADPTDGRTPLVILQEGGSELARYPLRNRRDGDPERKRSFRTWDCVVTVEYTGTGIEVNLKERGFKAFIQRWTPSAEPLNRDYWAAVNRPIGSLRQPLEFTCPGVTTKVPLVEPN